jgi:hypothetical protein
MMNSGWDSCDTWDRGPQPLIYFTTGHMVVGETITMDHLLSVYQGDANAVSDEGTSLMKNAQKWGQITFTRQMGMREQGF